MEPIIKTFGKLGALVLDQFKLGVLSLGYLAGQQIPPSQTMVPGQSSSPRQRMELLSEGSLNPDLVKNVQTLRLLWTRKDGSLENLLWHFWRRHKIQVPIL